MAKTARTYSYPPAARKRGQAFVAWLRGKGWTETTFARDSGIDIDTIRKWARGSEPKNMSQLVLRQRFPDCPLLTVAA